MLDIELFEDGNCSFRNTTMFKAKNILRCELGKLRYDENLGIDYDFFLDPNYNITNNAFNAYLVSILVKNGVNVVNCDSEINGFIRNLNISVQNTINNKQMIL
jgi:hypothetical protein